MGRLPEYKKFFTVHGKTSESLSELRLHISEMTDEEFNHHVNAEKNDFASWVRDILHEDALAERLESADSKEKAIELLDDAVLMNREMDVFKSPDFKRLMVREFIYGLLIGLIVGVIIGGLLI